jgi:hypothetical protein
LDFFLESKPPKKLDATQTPPKNHNMKRGGQHDKWRCLTYFGAGEGAHRYKNCGNPDSHAGCLEKKQRKTDAQKSEIVNPLVIEPRTRSGNPKVDPEKRKRDDAKPVLVLIVPQSWQSTCLRIGRTRRKVRSMSVGRTTQVDWGLGDPHRYPTPLQTLLPQPLADKEAPFQHDC